MSLSTERLYDEPRYYDIAFGWDITREVDFLEAVWRKLGTAEVSTVLDLACGTGRFAIELARRGYVAAGLDLSREMLGYARERASALGVPLELFLKDMSDFSLFRSFDAAICMTGSLPYLTSLESILAHLRQVAQHLKPGALYVVDLPVVVQLSETPFPPQEWTEERDRVKVSARWEVLGPYDPLNQLMTERLTLRGTERGWERVWEQEQRVRLFWPQEFLAIVQASGVFRLAGWYADFDAEREFGSDPLGHRMIAALVKAARPAPTRRAEGRPPDAPGNRRPTRGDRRDGRRGPSRERRSPQDRGGADDHGGRPGTAGQRDERQGTKKKRRRRPRAHRPKGGQGPGSGSKQDGDRQ